MADQQHLNDDRLEQIHDWLKSDLVIDHYHLESASADASFRRYFRLITDHQSLIIMDAPPDKEDSATFIDVAQRLRAASVNVPEVIAFDLDKGFLMLSDLGKKSYLDVLSEHNADDLYRAAIDALITMQSAADSNKLPDYDRALLQQEMQLFHDWLIIEHLQLPSPGEWLQKTFDLLVESVLEQPTVFVHRDYHSRNLTCDTKHLPGILDFQDAVCGPVSYDLVSLLRDCYIQWPQQQVDQWLNYYLQNAKKVGLLNDIEKPQFDQWFNLMGIQRHLKASGIFARLLHRDGKAGYLKDLPRTLGYIILASRNQPELEQLRQYLEKQVLPVLQNN